MYSNPRLRKRALAAALALMTVVGAACVKKERPGVAIKSVKSQIVFGLAPPAATPPGIAPIFDDLPIEVPELPKLPKLPLPKPTGPCRTAGRTDSPEKVKTTDVTTTPELGVFKWRANGELDVGLPTRIPLKGQPIERRITGLTPVETTKLPVGGPSLTDELVTTTFSYDVVTELGSVGAGLRRIDTYQVKNNPVALDVGTSTANIGKTLVVGDPERGVSLKRSQIQLNGQIVSTFEPLTGLLLLPLSVNAGEQYQSVAVDPVNGAVLVLDAVVGRPKDYVDACGDLVDGWEVVARETFIPPQGSAVVSQYQYIVATQLGGILVYEKVGPPDLNAIPIPTPPVIPGAPTPNLPSPPTSLPPLPVPLPTLDHTEELILSSLHPVRN